MCAVGGLCGIEGFAVEPITWGLLWLTDMRREVTDKGSNSLSWHQDYAFWLDCHFHQALLSLSPFPCIFFFHFKVRWTIAWITERITHCLFFFVASPEFTTVSSLSLSLSHFPKIYIPCTSYSFIFFVPSPIRWSCLLLWSPQPPFFAVSGIIDKCAWLWPLLAFSSFARHFVAFNHAFNCQWSSRWMAVERETSGILSLFLWVYTMEQELSPISRSDEDLTALVDSALGILAWYEVCVCILWL